MIVLEIIQHQLRKFSHTKWFALVKLLLFMYVAMWIVGCLAFGFIEWDFKIYHFSEVRKGTRVMYLVACALVTIIFTVPFALLESE